MNQVVTARDYESPRFLKAISDLPEGKEVLRENKSYAALVKNFQQNGKVVGRGTEADVSILPFERLNHYCLKTVERATGKSIYNPGVICEMDRQFEAFKILQAAEIQNCEETLQVPEPVVVCHDQASGKHSILMEFVRGKTVWRTFLDQVVENMSEADLGAWQKADLCELDDDQLSDRLIQILKLDQLGSEVEKMRALKARVRGPFLDAKVFDKLAKGIKILNSAGFYHRDLHFKNVMIGEEGKVWMIDFGYSINTNKLAEKMENPYLESRLGEEVRFSPDEGILSFLKEFVVKSEEEKKLERQKKVDDIRKSIANAVRSMMLPVESVAKKKGRKSSVKLEQERLALVEGIAENPRFKRELMAAITGTDPSRLKKLAYILFFAEFDNFQTTESALKLLKTTIIKYNPKSNLVNQLETWVREINLL